MKPNLLFSSMLLFWCWVFCVFSEFFVSDQSPQLESLVVYRKRWLGLSSHWGSRVIVTSFLFSFFNGCNGHCSRQVLLLKLGLWHDEETTCLDHLLTWIFLGYIPFAWALHRSLFHCVSWLSKILVLRSIDLDNSVTYCILLISSVESLIMRFVDSLERIGNS